MVAEGLDVGRDPFEGEFRQRVRLAEPRPVDADHTQTDSPGKPIQSDRQERGPQALMEGEEGPAIASSIFPVGEAATIRQAQILDRGRLQDRVRRRQAPRQHARHLGQIRKDADEVALAMYPHLVEHGLQLVTDGRQADPEVIGGFAQAQALPQLPHQTNLRRR